MLQSRPLVIRHTYCAAACGLWAVAMEELDECEVLWPETWEDTREPPPPGSSSPVPAPMPVRPSEAHAARSRPVDVPSPKAAARSCCWNGTARDDGDRDGGGSAIVVPPHLLLSGRRRSEAETAWTLRASGPPCRRARDLRHLRDAVLRMTGFIEG